MRKEREKGREVVKQKAGKDFQGDGVSASSRAVRTAPWGSHGLLVTPQESCGVNVQLCLVVTTCLGMSTGEGQGHRGGVGEG